MAGADYTTILMKNGKLMLFSLMDKTAMARGYALGAVKSHFEISRKSKETYLSKDLEDWFENDYDPAVRKSVLKQPPVQPELFQILFVFLLQYVFLLQVFLQECP